MIYIFSAPFFVIRHPEVKIYESEVFDKVKKGDLCLDLSLSTPTILCGDAKVEFFNKPKMMAKVLCTCICVVDSDMTYRKHVMKI